MKRSNHQLQRTTSFKSQYKSHSQCKKCKNMLLTIDTNFSERMQSTKKIW